MEFLSFIDDTSDIETFENGNFANDFMVGDLLSREIVMGQMSDSLKTVGKGSLAASEQVEQLLGWEDFVCEGDLMTDQLILGVGLALGISEQLNGSEGEQGVD